LLEVAGEWSAAWLEVLPLGTAACWRSRRGRAWITVGVGRLFILVLTGLGRWEAGQR